jgi:hypothetical protein
MPSNSKEFKADLITKQQQLTFSGVGAHRQNGVAERAIQTVTQWARSMLLHQALHRPDESRLDLWPFALEHAVYLWNHLPRKDSLIAPVELFTGSNFRQHRTHCKSQSLGLSRLRPGSETTGRQQDTKLESLIKTGNVCRNFSCSFQHCRSYNEPSDRQCLSSISHYL